ncbi:hypothetical protein EMCRGX_G014374 [Ephydatia muelleri]
MAARSDSPQPPMENSPPSSKHKRDEDMEEEDDLGKSMQDEVGEMLRATVTELEKALQEARHILDDRDTEISRLKAENDRYRQQAAKEIANKTKLAQALDESKRQATELHEILQQWQLDGREIKLQYERLKASVQQEQQQKSVEEKQTLDRLAAKEKEVEELKAQLIQSRQGKVAPAVSEKSRTGNVGPGCMDETQLAFLKQAVYHLLTDFHADDQLRAIISLLDFSAQERKTIYAKAPERKARRGVYT